MAVHPLRPATDRRLGRPLPCQLANQTRAHPLPPKFFTREDASLCAYAVLAVISNCCPPVKGRLPTRYSPVRHSVTSPKGCASFDLHVLGTPPAFILSQDQTLKYYLYISPRSPASSYPLMSDLPQDRLASFLVLGALPVLSHQTKLFCLKRVCSFHGLPS